MRAYGRAVSAVHAHSTKDSSTRWMDCAFGAQREFRVRARHRTHTNRKLLPLPRRRRRRFAALSLARRSAPPPLPRPPKLPLDEIWLTVIAALVLPLLCRGTGVDAARGARHDRPVFTREARAARRSLDDRSGRAHLAHTRAERRLLSAARRCCSASTVTMPRS
eukprot:scaffold9330_cov84-Phaeocystis_antarctica.AAC.1